MIQEYGEQEALNLLEYAKIIHRNYRFEKVGDCNHNDSLVYLVKKDSADKQFYLEPRKIVRIIRKETNIPLFACVSKSVSIHDVKPDILIVDFRMYTTLQHAKEQLFYGDPNSYELIVIPDEINLTRRMLYPLHKLHRLAADTMVPNLVFDNNSSTSPSIDGVMDGVKS
jgi:hypothetical protein